MKPRSCGYWHINQNHVIGFDHNLYLWKKTNKRYKRLQYEHFGNRCLVSLVGKVPVDRAGGSGSIPNRTKIQGLKMIDEKVLPLL